MEMNEEEIKDKLTEQEYNVLRESGTEAPYSGQYYKEKAKGMYNCKVCNTELFSSDTKFDSFSGWPSFYDVQNNDNIGIRSDDTLGMTRNEVFCRKCNSHLGHLFEDAPDTPTGNRYCINSCALDLKKEDE